MTLPGSPRTSQKAPTTLPERSQKPPSRDVPNRSQKPHGINAPSQVGLPGATPTYGRTYGLTKRWETCVDLVALRNAHEKGESEVEPIGGLVKEAIERIREPEMPARYPIRNHEPRIEIPKWVRAGIYHRDGQACVYCHTKDAQLVLDHITPRSSFPAHQLHIADRSDNLATACWDCNDAKSNYTAPNHHLRKPGITHTCPDCLINLSLDWSVTIDGPLTLPAFCLRHGAVTQVPNEQWIG